MTKLARWACPLFADTSVSPWSATSTCGRCAKAPGCQNNIQGRSWSNTNRSQLVRNERCAIWRTFSITATNLVGFTRSEKRKGMDKFSYRASKTALWFQWNELYLANYQFILTLAWLSGGRFLSERMLAKACTMKTGEFFFAMAVQACVHKYSLPVLLSYLSSCRIFLDSGGATFLSHSSAGADLPPASQMYGLARFGPTA